MESDEQMAAIASTSRSWLAHVDRVDCVRTQVSRYEYSFALKLSGIGLVAYTPPAAPKLWNFATFPQVEKTPDSLLSEARRHTARDQRSDIRYPDTSTLSHQLIDLDRMSDDHCIFASLPLSCTSASSCCLLSGRGSVSCPLLL